MFPQPVLTGLPVSPTYRVTAVFLRNLDDAILRIPPTPTTNVKRRKGTCVGQGRALLGCITVRPMKDVWHDYSESVFSSVKIWSDDNAPRGVISIEQSRLVKHRSELGDLKKNFKVEL